MTPFIHCWLFILTILTKFAHHPNIKHSFIPTWKHFVTYSPHHTHTPTPATLNLTWITPKLALMRDKTCLFIWIYCLFCCYYQSNNDIWIILFSFESKYQVRLLNANNLSFLLISMLCKDMKGYTGDNAYYNPPPPPPPPPVTTYTQVAVTMLMKVKILK